MQYKYDPTTDRITSNEGPWFDSPADALEAEAQKIEADLELGEAYRGGGVLKLAELRRKLSAIRARIAGLKAQGGK